jgi:hypothetical protein
MTTMPWRANAISGLPALLTIWDCRDFANDFVAGDDWKRVAEQTMLDGVVGMTDTASKNFDQDLEQRRENVNTMKGKQDTSISHTSPGLGSSSLSCLKVRGWPLDSKTAALYSLGRLGAMMMYF